ncbi:UDP-N-acetylmuramoyl-L-alanyl-D-glutamate--2,6-diaminopimelate ligase [Candidatus Dependentiae bacterium]|nr:UDP-N-acetylmuramoyl-L-alanyl-D-glutamate--2,6-diaminopimelate ligase [Candidatus Dependentiae bacterium]
MKTQGILPFIFPVACHTNNVGGSSIFVAVKGMKDDGVNHIPEALSRGARIIVVAHDAHISDEIQCLIQKSQALLLRTDNPRRALAQLSAHALNYPAHALKIIGITGTKGKTTTAFLLAHLLRSAGKKVALLSSVHNMIDAEILPTELTTQHPDYLHVFFDACKKNNIEYVVMETAAQAFSLDRVFDLFFDGVIFTNFSKEHAEFYPNQESYFEAKCQIFAQSKKNAPVFINADDAHYEELKKKCAAAQSFSLRTESLIKGEIISNDWNGLKLKIVLDGKDYQFLCPALLGEFNAYNILAAISMAHRIGIDAETIFKTCISFNGVPGRLELYKLPNGARGIIDKAHNASSFEAVLSALRPLTNKLIVVFGAGGDRDATKRPFMGAIASNYADLVIITSDNPRSEKLATIIGQIMAGIDEQKLNKTIIIENREKAILHAYANSSSGSIIALLGKGPDEYELVSGVKTYFSERSILQSLPIKETL